MCKLFLRCSIFLCLFALTVGFVFCDLTAEEVELIVKNKDEPATAKKTSDSQKQSAQKSSLSPAEQRELQQIIKRHSTLKLGKIFNPFESTAKQPKKQTVTKDSLAESRKIFPNCQICGCGGFAKVTATSPPNFINPAAKSARIVTLRDAARQIELAAEKLERLNLFQQADALRLQAKSLRQDARAMVR